MHAFSCLATLPASTLVIAWPATNPCSLCAREKKAVTDYNKSLVDAYNSSVHEGLVTGFGIGSMVFIMFCSYALAVWFGAKLILERGYTGGDVITIVFAVVTGSM
ncbi:putative ABC transporter type 1, transmembrane domain-containing protein [Helianthus annuus]|nr:putative ABC transporter type 1, transmembrane domain-containing protein [Helianthus annuus]